MINNVKSKYLLLFGELRTAFTKEHPVNVSRLKHSPRTKIRAKIFDHGALK